MEDTSIRVSEELADELYARKGRATSYEDFIWSLLERVDELEDGAERRDPAPEPAEPELADVPGAAVPEELVDQLREEIAGSGELLEARVDELLTMYDHLVDQAEAEKDELLEAVDVEATGYASAGSVWSNMIKGKDTLRALPGVETPPAGRSTWRYTGDRHE
jgi:hypothetical protein